MPEDLATFRYLAHLERVVLIRGVRRTGTAGPEWMGAVRDRCGTGSRSLLHPWPCRVQNGHVTQERPATARSEESHEA